MTATAERRALFPTLVSERPPPLFTRLRRLAAAAVGSPPVRGAVAAARGRRGRVVHAWGMDNFPRWVDDPGTYLSQAWAVQYEQHLSPYSYFYDHAPAGWIQIALWSMLTRGFDRYDSAMAFGNECMLLAKVASIVLLYWLARRLRFARPAAAGAGAGVRAQPARPGLHALDLPGQPRHALDPARLRPRALPQPDAGRRGRRGLWRSRWLR